MTSEIQTLEVVWTNTTAPYWTAIALAYGLAAVYQKAFSEYDYPWWTWMTMLGICGALLIAVNRRFILAPESFALAVAEFVVMALVIGSGIAMFYAFRQYARERTIRQRIEEELEKHDIDVDLSNDDY